MDKFLEKYNLPQLNDEEAESLSRPVMPHEIETLIKNVSAHKSPRLYRFTGKFCRAIKGELTPILQRLFQKFKKMEDFQSLFMKPTSS